VRQFIIGDIHGCYDELAALVDAAGLSGDDEIIAVGDLFDRGSQPLAVLDFFLTQPNARAVMGNHERKHIRAANGELEPARSQMITRHEMADRYDEALAFMTGLPLYIDLPDALIAHGFYEPGVPLAEQRDTVLTGSLSGEEYLTTTYDRAWYELYDGEKPIIVGHRDYTGEQQALIIEGRVYAIDTRCVYGGSLSGLLLPEFRLISVPARENHWEQLQSRYRDS